MYPQLARDAFNAAMYGRSSCKEVQIIQQNISYPLALHVCDSDGQRSSFGHVVLETNSGSSVRTLRGS